MYIDNPESLQKLCEKLEKVDRIFFDTEFMREKTFFPKLCLLQLGFDGEEYAVDPLATDIQPLLEHLVSRETLLVFHSGRQDLEILFNATGKLPRNVFDTQIAAMVCGFGEQVSYAELVGKLTGNSIDKSQRFTDWSARPLSPKQVEYALKDVEYLPEIYEKLSTEIEEKSRATWLKEEEAALLDASSYENNPADAWTKVKSKQKRFADMTVLKELAKWRDEQAIQFNKPRRRIVSDDVLAEFAIQKPKTKEKLDKMRIIGNVSRETLRNLMAIVIDADELPKEVDDSKRGPRKDRPQDEIIDLLKLLLKYKSEKLGVVAKLISSVSDLKSYAQGEEVKFQKGWRNEAFGKDAQLLMDGKLCLKISDGKFEVSQI